MKVFRQHISIDAAFRTDYRAMMLKTASIVVMGCLAVSGCAANLPTGNSGDKQNLTAGVVQREIRKGMTGGEVASVLGSPNIVTSGTGGTEVWVYDRTFTQVESANASTGVWFIVGTTGQNSSIARSSQSTLTVVVKFDANKTVQDVAYHQSKF